jgi:predicted RNA-binding protein
VMSLTKGRMMKIRSQVFTSVFVALLLVVVYSSVAQKKGSMPAADILAALKLGQWVVLEGPVQRDLSVQCTKLKPLTGDLLDDDWKIIGTIRKVDKQKQAIEILRLPIKVQPEVEFKDVDGKLKSFADVKFNMFVQAEGTYLKDGTLLAKQIKNEAAKLVVKPHLKDEIEARGKVEKIDPTNRTITLMGITFQLTDGTQGMSAIR